MSKPTALPLHKLRLIGRKARFFAVLFWRLGQRGIGAMVRRKASSPQPLATVDFDAVIEALQAGDRVALDRFARLDPAFVQGSDPYGTPWLFHAIDIGCLAALDWFLTARVRLRSDAAGRSPLQAAIERSLAVDEFDDAPEEPLPMIAALVTAGADVNGKDAKGLRPLHIAASLGAVAAAGELLRLGADAALPDAMGRSARDYAVRAADAAMIAIITPR